MYKRLDVVRVVKVWIKRHAKQAILTAGLVDVGHRHDVEPLPAVQVNARNALSDVLCDPEDTVMAIEDVVRRAKVHCKQSHRKAFLTWQLLRLATIIILYIR